MSDQLHADYLGALRNGITTNELEKLYATYSSEVLESADKKTERIEELAGGSDGTQSFLLACLSNGWPVRARDIDLRFLPPAGSWAFSNQDFGGLVRQFPSDCKHMNCADIADFDGFDVKSIAIGSSVTARLFPSPDFGGPPITADESLAVLSVPMASMKLRTAPRVDYVCLSDYQSDGTTASMTIHVSGANIDRGAVLTVDGSDVSGSELRSRLDNSSWLRLGTDLAQAGYNLDPTYFAYPIYHYDRVTAPLSNIRCGQVVSINVRNFDGQLAGKPLDYTIPSPDTLDSDSDGLLDVWETNGIDGVDLPAMGAKPDRKDLFIEVDQMVVPGRVWSDFSESSYPSPAVFPQIQAEYRRAPIMNPDGTSGIEIHIDYGQEGFLPSGQARGGTEIPWKRYIGFKKATDTYIKDLSQYCNATEIRDDPNYFDANRRRIFRYCIFADQQWSSRSTGAGNKSSIFFLTLGVCRMRAVDNNYQRGVFMHEFGHLLSLTHDGNQGGRINNKPNFNSLMNYLYVFQGSDIDGKITGADQNSFAGDFVYTYSEGMRMDLQKSKLSEVLGVANHYPIDWDEDGSIDIDPVDVKLHGVPNVPTLKDCSDWSRLVFPITK
ncbi:hypothetical protein [Planctomycetes bacterium K23_9]|uniref:hypothetical protein n=1 Tax=Stieleria marina TaxID=1930275 RepID=UPI0011A0957F